MKNVIALLLTFLLASSVFAAGRLQNEDFKSVSELTAAGSDQTHLLNDSKIYISSGGINDTFANAVANGKMGGISPWTASRAYSVGQVIYYTDNNIYKCLTANSDASFTLSKWQILGPFTPTNGQSLFQILGYMLSTPQDFKGNNATFDNSGTMTGVLSLSTTASDTILGTQVIKYTANGSNGQNDFFGYGPKTIPLGSRGTQISVNFQYKNGTVGANGDFNAVVKIVDGTLAGTVFTQALNYQGYPNPAMQSSFIVTIPSDCTQIKVGFQNKVTTTTAALYVDNIVISTDVFKYGPVAKQETWNINQLGSNLTTNANQIKYNLAGTINVTKNNISTTSSALSGNTSGLIYSPDGQKFYANGPCVLTISQAWAPNGTNNTSEFWKNGVLFQDGQSYQTNGNPLTATTVMPMAAGDYFTFGTSGAAVNGSATVWLNLVATQISQNILFQDTYQDAGLYGRAIFPSIAQAWSSTASGGVWANMTANGSIPAPTVSGAASAPSTSIPGITFATMPAGTYQFVANGSFCNNISTAYGEPAFRFYDGANAFGSGGGAVFANNASAGNACLAQYSGVITYSTTQNNVTIQFQVANASSTMPIGSAPLEINVFYYPPQTPSKHIAAFPVLPDQVYSPGVYNATGKSLNVQAINFGGASQGTVCSSTPCTIFNQYGNWVTSVTRTSTAHYNINVTTPFATVPICTCITDNNPTTGVNCMQDIQHSTTSVISMITVQNITQSDAEVAMICTGTR